MRHLSRALTGLTISAALFFGFTASILRADTGNDLSGKYQNPQITVEIRSAGTGYAGIITLGSQQFPLKATGQANVLDGAFTSQGSDFPFTATLTGEQLTLVTGGRTYVLSKHVSVANPLASPESANPLAAGPSAANQGAAPSGESRGLNGYTNLATIGQGRAVFAQKPGAKNVQIALEAAITDLNHFFDSKITVANAFGDAEGTHGGGAAFTAKLHGQAIKGSILCGIDEKGAAISVIYDTENAPPEEISKLISSLPTNEKLQEYQFPDGTGSVSFPAEWKCQNQSCIGGVRIEGPKDQVVTLGLGLEVLTPDSPMIAMQNQLAANAQQMGGPPPPPIKMLVAPYTEPVEALKNLLPQISNFSQQNNGPAVELDQIIKVTPIKAGLPGGNAQLIYSSLTKTTNGVPLKVRSLLQMEVYQVGQGTWGAFITELTAPDTSYDHDFPLMWKIAQSLHCNNQVIAGKTQNAIAQSNRNFNAFESAMKEKNDAFDDYQKTIQHDDLIRSRSNADFDEVIRGYRTVEDTQTGDKGTANLGDSTDIVNKLNEADPGRYKEIPLRDEEYPLPNQPNQ